MYNGITPDALFLLAQNKHENDKAFYDAHKAQMNKQVFEPLAQVMQDLADDFAALDPHMCLLPQKAMSRLRRDTRFTKEKHLYRDNVWMMFMRHKADIDPYLYPCMWFEIKPAEGYFSCGVCAYNPQPKFMQFVRECMDDDFLQAAQCAIDGGCEVMLESYKRPKVEQADPALLPYLNAKHFQFWHKNEDLSLLQAEALIEHLRKVYRACHPMYTWLMNTAQDYYTTELSPREAV
ncbi:MAG: DUF2461 domain-containing protein [Oscillospiraceae bacterium]|nr:DUF2461 domain-containing protein [Oscillospiraceae bacterium]